MNKTIAAITFSALAAVASSSQAASTMDRQHLAQCKSDLARVYGEDDWLRLKAVNRVRGKAHMRIKVISDQGPNSMVTCWVDRDGRTQAVDSEGLAVAIPGSDVRLVHVELTGQAAADMGPGHAGREDQGQE